MRIGIVHSFYRTEFPSGENLTVQEIASNLEKMGHQVSFWRFDSDSIINFKSAQLKQVLKILKWRARDQDFDLWLENQDVVQIHNYFPGITYGQINTLRKSGKKIHRVIHNYRKSCIAGNHFKYDTECYRCSPTRKIHGVIRRCYNRDFMKSYMVSKYSQIIDKFERQSVSVYIAISETISDYLENLKIPREKILIIPNSVPSAKPIKSTATDCVYFGRLEKEKGIFELVKVWRENQGFPTLHIVGNGTQINELRNQSIHMPNVKVHGHKSGTELDEILSECKVAIFPARWKEPFGRTLAEALARGQSVACSEYMSQKIVIKEGVNGAIFNFENGRMQKAIETCLNLVTSDQIRTSQELWTHFYSQDAISKLWGNLYRIPTKSEF